MIMKKTRFILIIATIITTAVFHTVPAQAFDDFYSDSEIQFIDPKACDPTSPDPAAAADPNAAPATPTADTAGTPIYMMGDSITKGVKTDLEAKFQAASLAVSKINGVGSRSMTSPGDGTTNGPQAITADTSIIKGSKTAILALGTNNSGTSGAFRTQVKDLVQQVKDTHTAADGPIKIFYVDIFSHVPHASSYNNVLKDLQATEGFTIIPTGGANIELSGDGVHPTPAGYKTLATTISGAVSSSVGGATPDTNASSTACCPNGTDTTNTVSGTDAELDALLKQLASNGGIKTTIAVGSLDGDTKAEEGGLVKMPTRSSYKIYVAYATLKAIEDGKISWSSTVTKVAGNDGAFTSGTVEQAMKLMLVNSDNAAASALRTDSRIGGPQGITDLLHSAGLSDGTVMGSGNANDPNGTNTVSTASDFVQFLNKLQKHSLPGVTNDANYTKIIDYMKQATTSTVPARDGIAKGVGAGTTVADKPGWGSNATNDVGIVYLDGNPYVVAILTAQPSNGSWTRIADIASKINAVMDSGQTTSPTPVPGLPVPTTPAGTEPDLVGATDAEKAYNYFIAKGLSPIAAAGIVGNLMQETGGGTENLHPEFTGSHNGIAQWDSGRFAKLQAYATKKGLSGSSLAGQLSYLWHELSTSYRGTLSQLKSAKTAEAAARAFDISYEISGECKGGKPGCDNRIKYAKEMLAKYGNGQGGSVADGQDPTICTCGDPAADPATGSPAATNDLKSFVEKYAQDTLNVSKKAGVPYDALLAQMAVESGNGNSTLTSKYFNFGGIKALPGQKSVSLPTTEVVNGVTKHVTARFRVFASAAEGIANQAAFFTDNPRYAAALKFPQDPERFIKEIAAAGYATDPNYATTLIGVLHSVQDILTAMGLPLSKDVVPDVAPAGGASTTSAIQGDCSSGAVAGDAVATALAYAWPTYTAGKSDQEPAYRKATAKAKDAGKYIGGGIVDGNDCGAFVTRVMQDSGADPNYGGGGATPTQKAYMKAHTALYDEFTPTSDADLQPGDIAVSDNHTYMFVGSHTGFDGPKASASIPNRAPMAAKYEDMTDSHGVKFNWFRVK